MQIPIVFTARSSLLLNSFQSSEQAYITHHKINKNNSKGQFTDFLMTFQGGCIGHATKLFLIIQDIKKKKQMW